MAAFFGEHQQPTVHKISLKIHILDLRVVPTSQNYAHFTSVKVLPNPHFVCYILVEMLYNQTFDPQVIVVALVYQKFL